MKTNQPIGAAQRRIVDKIKNETSMLTAALAEYLGVTAAAIRLQLNELESLGYVQQTSLNANKRGRPSSTWSLTDKATDLFTDRHSDLTIELIQSIREALGEQALGKVFKQRDAHLLTELIEATPEKADLTQKAKTLAKIRTRMGYMASVNKDGNALLLAERHCPVRAAAKQCQNLCRNELELFQAYMGSDASVERVEHLLSGDARCVYRIVPVAV